MPSDLVRILREEGVAAGKGSVLISGALLRAIADAFETVEVGLAEMRRDREVTDQHSETQNVKEK